MPIGTRPPAEVPIDEALVRALLAEQHPGLSSLTLDDAGEGWDTKRARGWPLALGLAYTAHARDDDAMRRLGLSTVLRALD
jgi:hypothetical protein